MYKREVVEELYAPEQPQGETFEDVVSRRIGRRTMLQALVGFGAAAATANAAVDVTKILTERADNVYAVQRDASGVESLARDYRLTMEGISQAKEDFINVPEGYRVSLVAKWDDPPFTDAPSFNVNSQSAADQEKQFGYNADFIAYMPLPSHDQGNSRSGLLLVNHAYTNPELMFPGFQAASPTKEQVDIQLAAHGATVMEVRQDSRGWYYSKTGAFKRPPLPDP